VDLKGMSPENPLGSIAIRDSTFTNITSPNRVQDVRSLTFERVTINGQPAR
jgi:hypothetical protein